ncbi:MAG: hypothetical protein RIA65_12425 [Woeseia sp.]
MNFSFNELRRTRSYWLVLLLFAAGNVWSAIHYYKGLHDSYGAALFVGLPFPFYHSSLPVESGRILWTGLLLDLVLAWTVAVIAGWLALLLAQRGP